MSTPVTAYLFRHGATDWNADGRWAGRAEMPMSDLGRRQIARLAERLAGEGRFARAFASPAGRARESAALVAARVGVEVEVDARLLEISYGAWEGRRPEEVRATPEGAALYASWVERPATVRLPGGEGVEEVLARGLGWLREVAGRFPGGRVMACSHRSTIRILLAHALGLSLDEYRRAVPQDSGALNVLVAAGDGTLRALAVNDTAHLAGLPRGDA
jgi:broad specificity phosphatase PhoE